MSLLNGNMIRKTGILPKQDISLLFANGFLQASHPLMEDQIQPASLDLRLGEKAWCVTASFLPGAKQKVSEKMERLQLEEIDLREGAVFNVGGVYIVPLLENLYLPHNISAVANPKSSTGRLDIFTRILTDYAQEFDQVSAGYCGPLFVEISPQTFPILVRTGSRLSQMRFRSGIAIVSEKDLYDLHQEQTLIVGNEPNITSAGIALSVDLSNKNSEIIGYRAKNVRNVIDVDSLGTKNVEEFWDPLYISSEGYLLLEPNKFYILMSQESVHVPPLYAAEMTPFDPLIGEFRVHYAGFFDPGFGHAKAGGTGSHAVLEVRSHGVPFILNHGQIIGRLVYEHMSSKPDQLYGEVQSNYQAQKLRLSKHFRV